MWATVSSDMAGRVFEVLLFESLANPGCFTVNSNMFGMLGKACRSVMQGPQTSGGKGCVASIKESGCQ